MERGQQTNSYSEDGVRDTRPIVESTTVATNSQDNISDLSKLAETTTDKKTKTESYVSGDSVRDHAHATERALKLESSTENESEIIVQGIQSIPDGGWRSWVVVIGSFAAMIATFGLSNSSGTIEDYLASERLSEYSQSDIGWIFSVWLFFMYFGGVQAGPVFDAYGLRPLLIPGCIGYVASIFILSVCRKYYQFILGFSILGGISCSMIFNPAITVIGHWFLKRRALATGFAAAGGSIGGIYMPLMLNKLFPMVGYGWAIRIVAFIMLFLLAISCMTLESRHVKRKVDWHEALIDVRSFLLKDFAFCVGAIFLVEWGVFVPIIYIVTYARAQGLSAGYSNAVLTYLNIGSTLGRTVPGYFADRYGNFNIMIITAACTGIFILSVWLPCGHTKSGLTAFAVLFGFWSGSTISLTPVCVSAICETKHYGKRYGTAYSIASIGVLTGLPIAGALTANNFLGLIIFSGVVYLAGAAFFFISRCFAAGRKARF